MIDIEDIKVLHVQDGDLVLVRLPEDTTREEGHHIRAIVEETLFSDERTVHVLAVQGDVSIEDLPVEEMKRYGWVRS